MDKDRLKHYTIGVDHIDDTHLKIFAILHNLKWEHLDGELVILLAQELRDLIDQHFRDEEAFMTDIGFKFIAPHQEDHKRIINLLDSAIMRGHVKQGYPVKYFADSIIKQFMHHIDWYDMQYSEYYKTQIVK